METDRPDDPGVVDTAAQRVAAYVHIPFCRRICPYCDFAVQVGGDLRGYVDAVVTEIGRSEPFDRPLDSVYVGGGTPTSVEPGLLAEILAALDRTFGVAGEAEVSLEANPEDVDRQSARALAAVGFNRMSLGVQSFDPAVLAFLGRVHDADGARSALHAAREVFPQLNVDLIFGSPGETVESWERTLGHALEAGVDHVSTYALTVERGTPLSRDVAAGGAGPDPDTQADLYEVAVERLGGAGLVHYETSNFAVPGSACVYNLITWAQGEYDAFGNGAHRHRAGARSWNVRRVDRYREAVEGGSSPVHGVERLGSWEREQERVLLGLRRRAGVIAGSAGDALVASEAGHRLLEAGAVVIDGERLVVARPLLGDEVARQVLALPEP